MCICYSEICGTRYSLESLNRLENLGNPQRDSGEYLVLQICCNIYTERNWFLSLDRRTVEYWPNMVKPRIFFLIVWQTLLSDWKFSEFYKYDTCHFVPLEQIKLQCFFLNFISFKEVWKKSSTKIIWESLNFLTLLKMAF